MRAMGALVVLVAAQVSVLGLSPASIEEVDPVGSAPDNHFPAGPDCGVSPSSLWCVGGTGRSPTVGAGIVSPASIKSVAVVAAPDDHFTAGPDCRVSGSCGGGVGSAGGCPTIRVGIISSASVRVAFVTIAAPH